MTLNLTDTQKDAVYEKLFYLSHPSTREEYLERLSEYTNERGYERSAAMMMMAADGVLAEDQFRALEEALEARRNK